MSAMRIMSKADFYSALEKNGFTETIHKTAENTLWLHSETKKHYPVPHYMEEIPDAILDEYLRSVGKLYVGVPQPECTDKHYCVTEQDPGKNKPHIVKKS